MYTHLRDVSDLTKDDRTRRYVMLSASGFDDDLEDEADAGYVTLIGPDDLVKG